ncbi:MAG: DUF368 domain-containing protein [Candidatus Omnitrophica bacterium]|nr:DUF368 domain-containing protein [Candidatus Omnitrophota bacterium]MCB9747867.1 DUF368 domain-containing protein [Candidatus Omnitrophota bacterium]
MTDLKKRTLGDYILIGLKGFGMGIADVIPGVSGGTIAFISGIYEELIESICSLNWSFVKALLRFQVKEALNIVAWPFLGSLFTGIILAVLTFSKVLSWLLTNKPVLINAFFFGLILATVLIIVRIIKKWSVLIIMVMIAAAIGAYYLVAMVPVHTPETSWMVFLSGALAICAMILPGISGAFILVLLGKYHFILEAINHREMGTIFIFLSGIVVGILSFVHLLRWLFHHFHDLTLAVLSGFVFGSLNKIWPWKETLRVMTTHKGKVIPLEQVNVLPDAINGEVFLAIGLIVFGFAVSFLLSFIQTPKDLQRLHHPKA